MIMENDYIIIEVILVIIGVAFLNLWWARYGKNNELNKPNMRLFKKGYGICLAITICLIFVTTIVAPIFFGFGFSLMLCPMAFFSFRLNIEFIRNVKLRNRFINAALKIIVSILIWIAAIIPLAVHGVMVLYRIIHLQ